MELSKIVEIWKTKLLARIAQDHSAIDITPEQLISQIFQHDPSEDQKYSKWILQTYVNNVIHYFEDFSKTKHALMVFLKHKNSFPLEQRDIQKFKSLSKLEDFVEPFLETKTGRGEKKELSEEVKKETQFVYRGSEGIILTPLTKKASIFWGQHTMWCTSATVAKNYFEEYNKKGPLFVILPKDGTKWQFHLQSSQLMDVLDEEVKLKWFNNKYPWVFENLEFSEEMKTEWRCYSIH